jgi:prepilin-type N-terminal cleavage/methylation domain-containing protein
MKNERGFTLIELLVVMVVVLIMATLGASAMRHYWFVRSVKGASQQVTAQLRQLQSQADSVSHPVVYGAWFLPNQSNSSEWGTLVYDPTITNVADRCELGSEAKVLPTEVRVVDAAFTDTTTLTSACKTELTGAGVANASSAKTVFFYARGNSTGGELTLAREGVGKERTIEIAALTGRVVEEE